MFTKRIKRIALFLSLFWIIPYLSYAQQVVEVDSVSYSFDAISYESERVGSLEFGVTVSRDDVREGRYIYTYVMKNNTDDESNVIFGVLDILRAIDAISIVVVGKSDLQRAPTVPSLDNNDYGVQGINGELVAQPPVFLRPREQKRFVVISHSNMFMHLSWSIFSRGKNFEILESDIDFLMPGEHSENFLRYIDIFQVKTSQPN